MKTNKKGFTIVELVIVIAVIAILAAVLIPTFNSVIKKAQESSAMQKAKAALDVVTMEENGDLSGKKVELKVDSYVFAYDGTASGSDKQLKKVNDTGSTTGTEKTYTNEDLSATGVTVYLTDSTSSK